MRGKFRKKKEVEEEPSCYAYTIGNGTENATIIDAKKSIWTAWALCLNQESNWIKLINVGICAFVVVLVIGLIQNHWIGLTIRIIMSLIYIILVAVALFLWACDTEKRGKASWERKGTINEAQLFWPVLIGSIVQFFCYVGICLFIPCCLLSNWSGREYKDDEGSSHLYSAYYYQSGQQFTKRYPTFWAWPWVKIAVLSPIADGSVTVSIDQRKVTVEYKAEYDPDQLVGITEVFYSGNPSENKGLVDTSLRVIIRSEMERASLPKDVLMLQKPLNTAFTDKAVTGQINSLRNSISNVAMSRGLIIGVKITSLKFPT